MNLDQEPIQTNGTGLDKKLAVMSIALTAVNVLIFLLQPIIGQHWYEFGALNYLRVKEHGEFYRLISCMFLHGGIEHIFSNMLILYYLGSMLEKAIGSRRFTIIYFVAGIGSGLASMLYEILSGLVVYSVGASGAIYGIIGAMLFLVIVNKGRYGDITLRRMLFAIFYMLYSGMREMYVNNAAHIGGLCCGFLISYLIYMMDIRIKEGKGE